MHQLVEEQKYYCLADIELKVQIFCALSQPLSCCILTTPFHQHSTFISVSNDSELLPQLNPFYAFLHFEPLTRDPRPTHTVPEWRHSHAAVKRFSCGVSLNRRSNVSFFVSISSSHQAMINRDTAERLTTQIYFVSRRILQPKPLGIDAFSFGRLRKFALTSRYSTNLADATITYSSGGPISVLERHISEQRNKDTYNAHNSSVGYIGFLWEYFMDGIWDNSSQRL
ncbi:uncharacterized protein BDR25DRAFT_393545 [Lindgomyces ingoldianus]|uniref:Uncharacterized protein n=1 Tax=Lindgomyces ingoldianus TaxID=673940 RepID=A0ACB6QV02_9PLEO|nr:uncharacterized protein BDR25DRAFT_393545 [Lindgomyces ingoldianus]KAF2470869.1 hypothetical protein BDR25DRAFT_393545 [Lindgomyces ingoldianus]